MANQTLTTTANYDEAALTGLANGETITINAGAMTINSDVRWAQNAAAFGSITISSTLAGSVLLDGGPFRSGAQLTLRSRYLTEAQTGVRASYAGWVRMDGGAWTELKTPVRDVAGTSTRSFSKVGYKTHHTYTFRCVVTATTGGGALTTRAVTLTFIAAPA